MACECDDGGGRGAGPPCRLSFALQQLQPAAGRLKLLPFGTTHAAPRFLSPHCLGYPRTVKPAEVPYLEPALTSLPGCPQASLAGVADDAGARSTGSSASAAGNSPAEQQQAAAQAQALRRLMNSQRALGGVHDRSGFGVAGVHPNAQLSQRNGIQGSTGRIGGVALFPPSMERQ